MPIFVDKTLKAPHSTQTSLRAPNTPSLCEGHSKSNFSSLSQSTLPTNTNNKP